MFVATKIAPLVDTRTRVTGCAPSQLKANGSVTNSVLSSEPSKFDKTVVPASPAIGLNAEQLPLMGVFVGTVVGVLAGGSFGDGVRHW